MEEKSMQLDTTTTIYVGTDATNGTIHILTPEARRSKSITSGSTTATPTTPTRRNTGSSKKR